MTPEELIKQAEQEPVKTNQRRKYVQYSEIIRHLHIVKKFSPTEITDWLISKGEVPADKRASARCTIATIVSRLKNKP